MELFKMRGWPAVLRTLGLVAVLAVGVGGKAAAVSPGLWVTTGVDDWTAVTRDSVAVTGSGQAVLGLACVRVTGVDASNIWELLADGGGLLAGTGDAGALIRIVPSGDAKTEGAVIQPEITALGRDGKGRILLGTAPDGVIYRLVGSDLVPVADTPESYIWKILPDGHGNTLIATGSMGKLYRLDGKDRLSLVATTGAIHLSGLTLVDGTVLGTTDTPGRLIRIADDGRIEVLFEADEPELREPVAGDDGAIFFLANKASGENPGLLYRFSKTGAADVLWTSSEGFAYRLARGKSGRLWIATGAPDGHGTLLRVDPGPPTRWREMLRVGEPQITALAMADGHPAWIGTGGVGRIYRVVGAAAPEGRAVSPPYDARGMARWGALSLAPGTVTGVRAATRSGNTKEPDTTWSSWTEVGLEHGAGAVASPPARFLQWRLTLNRPETRVSAVRVAFLPANRSPRITKLTLTPLGKPFESTPGRAPLAQELSGGLRVEFQTGDGSGAPGSVTDQDAVWARRYRTLTWTATDPNRDPLEFDLFLRAAGEPEWRPLKKALTSSPWVWDSATVPDGWYEIRATASDAAANAPGAGFTAARELDPFLVDNTPPEISGLEFSGGTVRGSVNDASSPIKSIELALDGGDWERVFPEDGIPDLPHESFRRALGDLARGAHLVQVRAADRAGNMGSSRLRIVVR